MSDACSTHKFANKVRGLVEQNKTYPEAIQKGLLEVAKPFISRPDLFNLGTRRPANHIKNSKYIYYDGDISITLDQLPQNIVVPPHDHGTWEALIILKGYLHHLVYDRLDDGSIDGHAKLKCVEDKKFKPLELAMVVPPAEIHSFTALSETTYVLTIVGGNYSVNRHYFDVENNTCVIAAAGSIRQKNKAA